MRVIGGWDQYLDENGRIRLPTKIAFDIANAGPGNLELKIDGRKMTGEKSGTRYRFDISGEGFNSGEHDLDVQFENIPLPDVPKYVICLGDQVVLTGRGLSQAQCGEPAVFTIDGSKSSNGRRLKYPFNGMVYKKKNLLTELIRQLIHLCFF